MSDTQGPVNEAQALSGTPERIWVWLADNGNIRKWDTKPFAEGTEYRADARSDAPVVGDAEIKAFREKYREIFPGSHPDRQTIIELLTASKQAVSAARPQPAPEPFGYYCECKGADPLFLREPAYIPPTDARYTTTPLYAAPQPAPVDEAEGVKARLSQLIPPMEPLGAEFEAVWDANRDKLYESDPILQPAPSVREDLVELVAEAINDARYDTNMWRDRTRPTWADEDRSSREYATRLARAAISVLSPPSPAHGAVEALPANVLEDAAKSAFVKAQSVYRSDHDHFPLKSTWKTATESVREGWRGIAYAALEAAYMPPLGTQPEPRKPRDVASAVAALAQPAAQEGWRPTELHIVFKDEGGPANLRFIEVETLDGRSVRAGTWMKRADGYDVLALSVHPSDVPTAPSPEGSRS